MLTLSRCKIDGNQNRITETKKAANAAIRPHGKEIVLAKNFGDDAVAMAIKSELQIT